MIVGGLYLVAICLSLGLVSAKHKQELLSNQCGECDPSQCKDPTNCLAGLVKDQCDCCDVCGKTEFELCQHRETADDEVFLGRCGDNMECLMREDLEEGDAPEAVCICKIQGDLCGSDGISYENLCQLQAASISKNEPVSVKNKGPCRTAPVLVTKPRHIKDRLGNNIGLLCEATGFPIPGIEWTWTRVDGKTEYLPSDDMRISANMRGGPEKMQITGWLQIQELQKQHEGDYTCIAQNELGMAKATARVNVLDHED